MSDPLVTISQTLVKLVDSSSKTIRIEDINKLEPFIEKQTLYELVNLSKQGVKDNIITSLCDIYKHIFISSIIENYNYSSLLAQFPKELNTSANVEHQQKPLINPSNPGFPKESSSNSIGSSTLSEKNHKEKLKIEKNISNLAEEEEKKKMLIPSLPKISYLVQPSTRILPSEVKPIKSAHEIPVQNDKSQHLNPPENPTTFDKDTKIQEKNSQPKMILIRPPEPPKLFSTVKFYLQTDYSQEKFVWEHELRGEWEIGFSRIFGFKNINTDISIKHQNNKLQLYQSKVETDQDAYFISIQSQNLFKNLLFLYDDYEIFISEIRESFISINVIREGQSKGINLAPDKPLWKDQMKMYFNVEKENLKANIYMGIGKWFIANEDSSCILYRMIHISENMNKNSQMIMIEEDKIIKYRQDYIIKIYLE